MSKFVIVCSSPSGPSTFWTAQRGKWTADLKAARRYESRYDAEIVIHRNWEGVPFVTAEEVEK